MSRPRGARRALGLALSATVAAVTVPLLAPTAWATGPESPAETSSPSSTPSPSPTECKVDSFSAAVGDGAFLPVEPNEAFEAAYQTAVDGLTSITVAVIYDPDHDGAVDEVPADCTLGFQLESYETEGDTFETSGTQTWVDGDGGTITASNPSLELTVEVPACFHQTDFSSQDEEFGVDDYNDGLPGHNPVPDYDSDPRVLTPGGIAASTGGSGECVESGGEVAPVPPTADTCAADGVTVTLTQAPGLVWSVDGTVVTEGTVTVPVAEDAAYAIDVTVAAEDGYTLPDDATTAWTLEGVRDCADVEPGVVTPPAPTVAPQCTTGSTGALVTLPAATGVVWSVDGTVVTTPTVLVPAAAGSAWSLAVTASPAAGTTFPEGAQASWTFSGTLVCSPTPAPTDDSGVDDDTRVEGTRFPAARGSGADDDELARTGAEAGVLAAGAAGLVALGGSLLLLARRREAAHRA